MPFEKVVLTVLGTPWPPTLGGRPVRRQGEAAPSPVQTHVVTTDRALRDDSEPRLPTRLAANASLWEQSNLVSLKHYLELFQKYLSDQYYLVFLAVPKKKAGFQCINVETEVANSEIAAPDNLWVPAAGN